MVSASYQRVCLFFLKRYYVSSPYIVGFDSSETIKANLNSIRKTLNVPADAPVPAGVGFLGWITDMTEASEDPRLPAVLAEKIQAVWFAFGNDLGKHIKTVQDYDAKRTHKTKIFVIVNSLDEAKRAANEWKVDALVVQGMWRWVVLI